MDEAASLDGWDITTIVLYFAIVLFVGIWATIQAQRGSARGFFLAGKSMSAIPIAGSIFATNMGATMFVGLAGTSASSGFAPVMFEWHATYMLIFLGWIFVPIYVSSGTFTMPQYLRKRYGGQRIRVYYAIVQLTLAILSGISAEIYAGAVFIHQLLGWNVYAAIILILAITAVYTIGGGLAAVMYTDALQAIVLVAGSAILTALVVDKINGYEAMVNQFIPAGSNTTYLEHALHGNMSCGFPPDDAFHIFRPIDSDYPWPGLTFGLTILATYYFCANQVIVQRNLAAKDIVHNKMACVIASYLKILPFFLFTWPGMISRILYPDEVGCTDPDTCEEFCLDKNGCTNAAYPILVLRDLPSGLRGLMLAAMLAALMSSLTSQYNSYSSIFVVDIWKVARKQAGQKEVVIVGRIFSLILIILSVAWLPILQVMQGGQLWDYLQSISSYITPPWVAVFLLGIFWKRCSEQGAWWGLMAGLVVGGIRMGLHFSYPDTHCGSTEPDPRPDVLTKVHYLHFALILFTCSLIVIIAVTYITKPRSKAQLRRVTWWTRREEEEPELTEDEEEDIPDEPDINEKEELTVGRRVYNWMCGFETSAPKLSKEELEEQRRKLTDIDEEPKWSTFCDINAVIAVAVTCFIIGFYA